MALETDPKVVARLAREKEDENWRFRSFLKGAGIGEERLDSIVHGHYEEVASRIDCCSCGNCCEEVLPELDDADVARLATGLGLSENAVVEQFLVPGEEKDTYVFDARPCPFLKDRKCGVYDSRPSDCRSFPHLHRNEFVSRLMQAVGNCSICPIVYNVFERLKDELWHQSDFEWETGIGE